MLKHVCMVLVLALSGCAKEMNDWYVCSGAVIPEVDPDDPDAWDYYDAYRGVEFCFENNFAVSQKDCEAIGGKNISVLQTEGAVVESNILDPLVEEECIAQGYPVACAEDGFIMGYAQNEEDCALGT